MFQLRSLKTPATSLQVVMALWTDLFPPELLKPVLASKCHDEEFQNYRNAKQFKETQNKTQETQKSLRLMACSFTR